MFQNDSLILMLVNVNADQSGITTAEMLSNIVEQYEIEYGESTVMSANDFYESFEYKWVNGNREIHIRESFNDEISIIYSDLSRKKNNDYSKEIN